MFKLKIMMYPSKLYHQAVKGKQNIRSVDTALLKVASHASDNHRDLFSRKTPSSSLGLLKGRLAYMFKVVRLFKNIIAKC